MCWIGIGWRFGYRYTALRSGLLEANARETLVVASNRLSHRHPEIMARRQAFRNDLLVKDSLLDASLIGNQMI